MARADDPRLGQLFVSRDEWSQHKSRAIRPAIALISVPSDEGVRRNGGRVGACEGPRVLMDLLQNFGAVDNREWKVNLKTAGIQLVNYGQTESGPLEQVHTTLRSLVSNALSAGLTPLCLGGGNDQSAANGQGWIEYWTARGMPLGSRQKFVVINVDAHLDVRPLIIDPSVPQSAGLAHSGSPFRQLIELAKGVTNLELIEFASQGQQCAAPHVDYVLGHGGQIIWLSELDGPHEGRSLRNHPSDAAKRLRRILERCADEQSRVFFSFDVDAIRASDCPGVSCPSPIGLTCCEALNLCYEAGKCPVVDLMDISEFNPRIESSLTSRLLANMIYHFLLGYAERPVS